MHKIVQMKFGSHLYGTATALSDLDVKAVYIPLTKDILLQRVQPVISQSRLKTEGEKNTVKDVDYEAYSPENFLRLLAEGQTMALDMLFTPNAYFLAEPLPLWKEIQEFAPQILNKKAASFVSYCRQQAHKYGTKGARIAAARLALEFLIQAEKQYGGAEKLKVISADIHQLSKENTFLSTGELLQPDGNKVSYFEICGKKALLGHSIKSTLTMVQRLIDEYGARTLAAEKNEGVDWKALSHAVRIGHEAIEFLSTHKLTFPRPEAKHLLAIKEGKLPFPVVAEEIESLLVEVEIATKQSTLPENYAPHIIDDFIEHLHRKIVISEKF